MARARVLSEEDFIREIRELEASGFAGAAPGPVTVVEGLDADGRVCWRGYYLRLDRLVVLAEHLLREREASSST
jgi:hypothetical protein